MERRRLKRFHRRLTVRYGERDLSRSGMTHDISASGVFVVAQGLPPLDTRLHLQISTSPERFAYFEGVVRRHKVLPVALRQIDHGGFGVQFLQPGELVGELVPLASTGGGLEVVFESVEHLRRAVETEIRFGGVFIPTTAPYARDMPVTVELCLAFARRRFTFPAKVVQVISANARGIAVAFDQKQEVERTLEPFLAR
jgi:Tfp pilus assembly protein PilZ